MEIWGSDPEIGKKDTQLLIQIFQQVLELLFICTGILLETQLL